MLAKLTFPQKVIRENKKAINLLIIVQIQTHTMNESDFQKSEVFGGGGAGGGQRDKKKSPVNERERKNHCYPDLS